MKICILGTYLRTVVSKKCSCNIYVKTLRQFRPVMKCDHTPLYGHPDNTAKFSWPAGDLINGVLPQGVQTLYQQ